jgi:prolyl oligopeptidase
MLPLRLAPRLSRFLVLLPLGSLLAQQPSAPPKAPVRPVTDEYFGQKIVDPYRWMEDDKNPELLAWMKAQAAYARAYLNNLPGYPALLQRCREVETGDVQIDRIVRSGNRFVYAKLRPGENLAKLYVRHGSSGPERLLYDPAKESTDQKHVSVGDFQLSKDGRFASYVVMRGGGEFGDLRLIDLETGRDLPDVIPDTRWFAGSWAPDGKSLLYIHFQKLAPGAPDIERIQKTAIFLHRVGAPVSADKPVFGYGADPRVAVAPTELGLAEFRKGSAYAVAYVNSGVSPESDFYLAKSSGFSSRNTFLAQDRLPR